MISCAIDRSMNLKTKDDPAGLLTTEQKYRREQMGLVLALIAAKDMAGFLEKMESAGVDLVLAGGDADQVRDAIELAQFYVRTIATRSTP